MACSRCGRTFSKLICTGCNTILSIFHKKETDPVELAKKQKRKCGKCEVPDFQIYQA